jgi:hypothetical protein
MTTYASLMTEPAIRLHSVDAACSWNQPKRNLGLVEGFEI